MIFLFIMNEFSVDNFHQQRGKMYRVMRGFDNNGDKSWVPYLSGPYAPALLNDFPAEIKKAVQVRPITGLISFQDKGYNEKKVCMTDDNFFTLFSLSADQR